MNSYDTIYKALREIAGDATFSLDIPEDVAHGDYATNIAFVMSKKEGVSPRDYALKVIEQLKQTLTENVSDIQIAGPGFINFSLKDEVRTREALSYTSQNVFTKEKNGKIIVEYTDPNPFKLFHIGHLVPNAIGEAIARLYEAHGKEVTRVCYQGDVGMHVAKAIFGFIKRREELGIQGFIDTQGAWERYIGEAYALGNERYENDEESRLQIQKINKSIYLKDDQIINTYYDEGREWSLKYFDSIYKKLGTKFDHFIMESEVAEEGKEIVKKHLGAVFEESEGALVYKGEKVGLHTRVFVNKEWLPTYEAKELGNTYRKKSLVPDAEQSIVVTGNEIDEYFKVIKAALGEIDKPLSDSITHISHGMLRLPEGKMSSRTGNIIPAEELIDKVKEHIKEKIGEAKKGETLTDTLLNDIAVGSIKFAILKSAPGKDMIFDFEKSLSFEGDSGPYLQYTHARLTTLLEKGANISGDGAVYKGEREKELEQVLNKYDLVLTKALREIGPHHIVQYLLLLTRVFNSMYARVQIVNEDEKEKSAYYLALARATKNILNHGLTTLGIVAPERM
jgi:arginyl-tRNA synthetase